MTEIAERPITRTVPQLVTRDTPEPGRASTSVRRTWTSPSLAPGLSDSAGSRPWTAPSRTSTATGSSTSPRGSPSLHGYAHPRVASRDPRQADELLHYSASDFYLPIYAETGGGARPHLADQRRDRVFIANSGTRGR